MGMYRDLQIIVDNRNGTMWDITSLVPQFGWKTSRVGKPGSLDLTVVLPPEWQSSAFTVGCGDVVRVQLDGRAIFYGYVFTIDSSAEREWQLTAYDQIRYLLEADSYYGANVKASQVLIDNAKAIGLTVGHVTDTEFVIPVFGESGQKRLDMICKALDQTLLSKGTSFVLYDDAGRLTLRNLTEMRANVLIGDRSLAYGYSASRSIDSETYNRIKLAKDKKSGGGEKVKPYELEDRETIAKWGRLQLYQTVDEGLNEAQIKEMAERLLKLKNREQRKFSIEALGDISVRAGSVVQVTIAEQGINQNYLVEECKHSFQGGSHTMSLELRG
ncbi:hypothetical protein [Cohnella sp. GCM10027633]|uniref:XkdQ/YqbQ family protein n=1 Tax=unclassified Cohnella TaxID=2636738 RepID=UPI003635604A